MWFIVEWQFAQITAAVSWKLIRPTVVPSEMLVNGHTPVYGEAPPTSVGAAAISIGNLAQSNVSCTHLTRRNARLPKKWAIAPVSVRTPTLGPVPAQSAGVNVAVPTVPSYTNVGQVPVVAVNSSV